MATVPTQTPHRNVNFNSIPKAHSDVKNWYCHFSFNNYKDTKASCLLSFFFPSALLCTTYTQIPIWQTLQISWRGIASSLLSEEQWENQIPFAQALMWKSSACCTFLQGSWNNEVPKEKHHGAGGDPGRARRPQSCSAARAGDLAATRPQSLRGQPSPATCAFLQESWLFVECLGSQDRAGFKRELRAGD